jgi:Glycosyl transferases group 1
MPQTTIDRCRSTEGTSPVAILDSSPPAKGETILAFATQGREGDDEARLRELLQMLPVKFLPFERNRKRRCFFDILRKARKRSHRLFVMEGTGCAGGAALILSHWLYGAQYVFSSGDAIAPFLSAKYPLFKPLFRLYEGALYRNAAGFIGWTPYLVGRALTMGAKHAVSAAGWAPYPKDASRAVASRARIRKQLGIPDHAVVFGIAGSLAWAPRVNYCYGYDLVQAALQADSESFRVLIVGDGEGMKHLKKLAGDRVGRTILFPGRVPRVEVPDYLAAMDVGSLPQSIDGVGSFRYTTKVSEYLGARLPFVTNQIPLSYDLAMDGLWRLPGRNPWDPVFVRAIANLMNTLTLSEAVARRNAVPGYFAEFDRSLQVNRVTQFLEDLMGEIDAV